MDEELLRALMNNFELKGDSDMGEGDYRDLLWQVMHATNQGASEDELEELTSLVPQARRDAMLEYGGGPSLDPNLFNRQHRQGLNRLLKR